MYLKEMRPYQLKEAVAKGWPLMVPAGCIETHGPHMAIGHDTLIVEEICARISAQVPVVIAPSFDYGPTGYALGGPQEGTIDPDYASFGFYVKSILKNFRQMGFRKIYVPIMHQGMEAPLALAFKKAAAELTFEEVLERGYPRGWWGDERLMREVGGAIWGRVEVQPMILPGTEAGGDHAGYNETSFLLATRPELVEQDKLDEQAPWYCRQDEKLNSWSANAEHGQRMVEAVVEVWVAKIRSEA